MTDYIERAMMYGRWSPLQRNILFNKFTLMNERYLCICALDLRVSVVRPWDDICRGRTTHYEGCVKETRLNG